MVNQRLFVFTKINGVNLVNDRFARQDVFKEYWPTQEWIILYRLSKSNQLYL